MESSKYHIRFLSEGEYEGWDEFVANSKQGTLFHKTIWLSASNLPFEILGCFQANGQLIAGMPITYQKKFGFTVIRPPFLTPYMGIVFKDDGSKYVSRISKEKEIMRLFAKRIKEIAHFAYINLNFDFIDAQPFIWEGFSVSPYYTYLLNIEDLEAVWNGMVGEKRNDIKRAEKDGIYVEVCDDFDRTFALVERTFSRQNKDIKFRETAYRYNDVLTQRGLCRSFLAINKDGRIIASEFIVWDEKRSYFLLSGYDHEYAHRGADALAMWGAIKFSKEQLNLNELDLEGSMVPQIERYFRKFGGRLAVGYTAVWCRSYLEPLRFWYELTQRKKYKKYLEKFDHE